MPLPGLHVPYIPAVSQGYSTAKPGPYQTILSPEEEAKYQAWVKAVNAPVPASDEDLDYDMRGFYKALQSGDPRAQSAISPFDGRMHFPDVWKMPNHPTFSAESQYATPDAPKWNEKDQLIDKYGRMVADESTPKK